MVKQTIFFLLISTSVFCQKITFKGTLLDKETKRPVVYANLSFFNSNKGISSNEDGTFSMNLPQKYLSSKVHISCLNYKDTIVKASSLQNKTVYLQSKSVMLDEVTISKRVEKSITLGQVKNRVEGVHTTGMRMLAKYFPKDKRAKCCSYLETIEIHFAKKNRHRKEAKFRIRIFNKDKTSGLPKEDLLNVNLPVEIKNGQEKVRIDVSNYNLEIPENGLFVAFEKLFIPFNQYGKNENDSENEFYYAPIIGYTKYSKKDRNENMYLFVKGSWQLSPLNKVKQMKKYAPAIALKLTN